MVAVRKGFVVEITKERLVYPFAFIGKQGLALTIESGSRSY